ncbi:MAG: hypothetical protein AB7R55_13520 [Gemmatimonadales bacterium]
MLEIRPSEAVIAACHAAPAALDELPAALGLVLRIAPDEAWVLARRARRAGLVRALEAWLASADRHGVVVDQTDGWTLFDLRGPEALELFGRLSVTAAPATLPALVQGALSGVAGKAWFAADGGICLMVPAPVGHHLAARLRAVGSDLELAMLEPEAFRLDGRDSLERERS